MRRGQREEDREDREHEEGNQRCNLRREWMGKNELVCPRSDCQVHSYKTPAQKITAANTIMKPMWAIPKARQASLKGEHAAAAASSSSPSRKRHTILCEAPPEVPEWSLEGIAGAHVLVGSRGHSARDDRARTKGPSHARRTRCAPLREQRSDRCAILKSHACSRSKLRRWTAARASARPSACSLVLAS
jgi:hypothetical protein